MHNSIIRNDDHFTVIDAAFYIKKYVNFENCFLIEKEKKLNSENKIKLTCLFIKKLKKKAANETRTYTFSYTIFTDCNLELNI